MPKSFPRALIAIQAAVLAGLGWWVFAPALHGTWLWDDSLEISQNAVLRDPQGWRLAWIRPTGLDYLPLKTDLQWVEWHLWGDRVAGYHAANIALHLLGAFLLWQLLSRLGLRWAWLGALIFAVHPLAVESVAWIAEFKNVASFPLVMVSALAFLRWIDADSPRAGPPAPATGCLIVSGAAFAAAMLIKTSAAPVPVLLLVLGWWRQGRVSARAGAAAAALSVVSIVLGLITLHCQWTLGMRAARGVPEVTTDWIQAGSSLMLELRDALYPRLLSPVYAPVGSAPLAAAAAVLLAGGTALFLARRRTWGGAALLTSAWFVGCLLPVLGLVPMAYLRVAPRADHLAYLSLAAGAGGAAAVLGALGSRAGQVGQAALGAITVTGLLALALSSRNYSGVFVSPDALWRFAAAREPGAWVAHANLGRVELDAGRWAEAAKQLSSAAALQPRSAEVRTDWGNALRRLGRSEEAEAQYRAAIRIEPDFAGARYDYGQALLVDGQPAAAAEALRAAVKLDPQYAAAHNNLGLALMRLGDSARAIDEYRAALRWEPGLAEAHLNLGNAYFRQGDAGRAAAEYQSALSLRPHYQAAHLNLSRALMALGRMDEARAEIEAADR
ncbi:MAG TPA: tetratricopeptide repeat protein [Opitutaceae bacterium]